ncbi:MAG: hypothetical protein H0X51_09550 [Parachlamydiaceae bacterium]|nr:hypothetical protein [Parachlamydiaceae bacterium]
MQKCLGVWIALLLAVLPLSATELAPWLGQDLMIESRATYLFQSYRKIQTPNGSIFRHANDNFFTLGASFVRSNYSSNYSAEIEGTIADTHRQHFACDNLRLTLRYRMLNDIVDDCFTLTPGITITKAFKHSVRDPSSFHHGEIEAELHVAVGREASLGPYWRSRWWAVAGVGQGDHGEPWLRGDWNWERNWWNEQQQLHLFLHTLCGLGNKNLSPHKHFKGYGSVRHRSIDIGARYSYLFECDAILSLEYARRVYAHNFPMQANLVQLQLFFPFGL